MSDDNDEPFLTMVRRLWTADAELLANCLESRLGSLAWENFMTDDPEENARRGRLVRQVIADRHSSHIT